MKIEYKGFDIDVEIRNSVGGYSMLYYEAFRKSDLWELTSGYSETTEESAVIEWIEDMKNLVNDYLDNPESYKDEL